MLYSKFSKPAILIPTIMLGAAGLVSILAWRSLQPIPTKNGFSRSFSSGELKQLKVLRVPTTVTGIAGTTEGHIYFKTKDPSQILVTDRNFASQRYINLNLPGDKKIASAFYTVVDSPAVYIMAGNAPAVIKTDLTKGVDYIKKFPKAAFTRAVVIGANSYVFRGLDTVDKKVKQILIKGNPQNNILIRNKHIGVANDPLGITTDGYLNYDKKTNLLVYTSFYTNSFFCVDTNLALVHSGHTIDTVTAANIKSVKLNGGVTSASPLRLINGRSRVSNGALYIISKLPADNETTDMFNKNATIDQYDIKTGQYLGSFRIPFHEENSVSDFVVTNENIIVLYKKGYAALYKRSINN